MTQEEILDYNKRCVKFLGGEGMQKITENNGYRYPSIEEMKFDSDWNWIMEVLNKISSLDFGWKVTSKYVNIYSHIGDTRGEFNCMYSINCPKDVIKDVIKTINQFLKYYEKVQTLH